MTAAEDSRDHVSGERLPEPVWRMRPLVLSHLAAAVLLASWLLPVSRGWWDQLDVAVFRFLNGSLNFGEWWQMLWALANNRNVDFVSGGLAALIVIWWLWGQPREIQNKRCAALCGLALMLLILPIVSHYIVKQVFHYQRLSPTLVFDDALRLSQLVPSVGTKDVSIRSFPGDHAFILLSIAIYFWSLAPRRIAVAASILAVIFLLPRMVGGAHWLTDNIMGGAVPALLVIGWLLATPLGYHLAKIFLPLVKVIIALTPKWLRIPERTVT